MAPQSAMATELTSAAMTLMRLPAIGSTLCPRANGQPTISPQSDHTLAHLPRYPNRP